MMKMKNQYLNGLPVIIFIALCQLVSSCSSQKMKENNVKENKEENPLGLINPPRYENIKNIFSYDSLVKLNENNPIEKQIRGRWQLDSILLETKRIDTKLMLDGFDIRGLTFESNFYCHVTEKAKPSGYWSQQLGIYYVEGDLLTIKKVDGRSLNEFQIDESSEKYLVLSEKFRTGRKVYHFSLDLEHDKLERAKRGPNYKWYKDN